MSPEQQSELLSSPYRLSGRSLSGIDCLGVVLHILKLRGRPQIDPLKLILRSYRERAVDTVDVADAMRSGFGPDWRRVQDGSREELDVWLFHEAHSWAAILHQGSIWSAHPDVGVWNKPMIRFTKTPHEVWRQQC